MHTHTNTHTHTHTDTTPQIQNIWVSKPSNQVRNSVWNTRKSLE
jgi:hypothetical protein